MEEEEIIYSNGRSIFLTLHFVFFCRYCYDFSMSSSGQPFPMSKLLYMYVKKLAEPLSSRLLKVAKHNEKFKIYLCLPPANMYHFYEAKIKFRVLNIGKIRMADVPKLSEKEAVKLGANLFSECLIYAVASAFALNEYLKYKTREKEKDATLEADLDALLDNVAKLNQIVENQICDIKSLDNIIGLYKKKIECI